MKSGNIFSNIPSNLEHEIFESIIEHHAASIERIISKGQKSPESGWYDQEKNEWVIILKGKAIVLFDNQASVELNEGDFINIPSHTKHRVDWTDPDNETVWLAVHY
jgi:cupin 2 domain-containing protein